jgi:hypothetical protein
VVLQNCLISGNQAGYGGGVACDENGTVRLENCIVTNNRAMTGRGKQIYIGNGGEGCPVNWCEEGRIELVHSSFDEEISFIYRDYESGWGARKLVIDFHGQGNISGDPLFVLPGFWHLNGTPDDPNDDLWVDGDYHLKSQAGRWDLIGETWIQDEVTSPCIDTGDPDDPVGYEPFPNGGIVNMGVYGGTPEASKSYFGKPMCETIMAGDINGDCMVDCVDLALLMRHWSSGSEDANLSCEPINPPISDPNENPGGTR